MQLLRVVFCLCVIVQILAAKNESTFQETEATKGAENGLKPEPLPAEENGVEKEVVPKPSRLFVLISGSARTDLGKSSDRGGPAEIQGNLQFPVAVSDQPDGDPRLKRSPHGHFKGCFTCGYGGGGYYPPPHYVQPVYAKPVYVQPVYVKPVVYSEPIYSKPVYSQPYHGSGCSTCGQWGDGSGSFSYSQSSASSSGWGHGKK
jgi:hypothetical protein